MNQYGDYAGMQRTRKFLIRLHSADSNRQHTSTVPPVKEKANTLIYHEVFVAKR